MKQKLINFLLKHTINAVTIEEVISSDKTGIYIDGKKITRDELLQLQAEVKAVENTRLWYLMTQTLKKDAYERGLNTSTSMDQVNTAKAMLYNLSIQESIMNVIRSCIHS